MLLGPGYCGRQRPLGSGQVRAASLWLGLGPSGRREHEAAGGAGEVVPTPPEGVQTPPFSKPQAGFVSASAAGFGQGALCDPGAGPGRPVLPVGRRVVNLVW